jgi:transcription antitermination factor NusG
MDIKELKKEISDSSEWYAVPPYKKVENWKIVDNIGQYVASFEMKEHCIEVVKLHNKILKS